MQAITKRIFASDRQLNCLIHYRFCFFEFRPESTGNNRFPEGLFPLHFMVSDCQNQLNDLWMPYVYHLSCRMVIRIKSEQKWDNSIR